MSKLIIGCGYVGQRLARAWQATGETVFVTTRSEQRAAEFANDGYQPIVWDITQDLATAPHEGDDTSLPAVDTVVFAVGFDRRTAKETGQTIEEVYVGGLRRVLRGCPPCQRFIYLSSTGVYGQGDGNWVDEDSDCQPNRDGGKACLAAEQLLQQHEMHGQQSIVLRLAGIYGPDRLPQAAMLKRGEPLSVAADAYLNLVHVDDIVRTIQGCEQLEPPSLLCVSDGHPVIRRDFYSHLANLLGTAPPIFEPPVPGSSRAERARGSKRISNRRLVEQLQPSFLFPTYREGLEAIVSANK